MPRARILLVVAAILVVSGSVFGQTAVTATYVGPTNGGNWATAANWSTSPNTGTYPNNDSSFYYNVNVALANGFNILNLETAPANVTVNSLTMGGTIGALNSAVRNFFVDTSWNVTSTGGGLYGGSTGSFGLTAEARGPMTINSFFSINNATLQTNGGSIDLNAGNLNTGGGVGGRIVLNGSNALNVNINDGTSSAVAAKEITITGNAQLVRKTGTGTATVSATKLNNSETVEAQTGTLVVQCGTIDASPWVGVTRALAGTTVRFNNGRYDMSNSQGVVGAGTWEILANATILLTNGSVSNGVASVILDGGKIDSTAVTGVAGMLFDGAFTWKGNGEFSGPAYTTFNGPLTIAGPVGVIGPGQFYTNGTTTLTQWGVSTPGNWFNGNGSNAPVFNIAGDVGVSGSSSAFTNTAGATFRKTAGTGTSSITKQFINDGLVEASSGILSFRDFNQSSTGTLRLSGGTVQFAPSSGTVPVPVFGVITGSGTIENTTFAPVHVHGTIRPGTAGTAGTLTFARELQLQSSSSLSFDLGTASDRVNVTNGPFTLDGTLNVTAGPGFGAGTYILIDYNGALTDNGLILPTPPEGFAYDLVIDTTNTQVLLVVTSVPEPAGALLFAAGAASGAVLCRRSRK